ncbi:MAG: stage V sporulation protein AD [Clostridia bacterium]|nr:stage V sporulation protein AD [Clostridia bacterium]
MARREGKYTIFFNNRPSILSYGSVVGKREHEGPLSKEFDCYTEDSYFGEKSYEKAESKLQKTAVETALKKQKLKSGEIDCIFAGDLLNQCIGSSFGLMDFRIPFVGLYGACSTMALSVIMASLTIDSGAAKRAVAVTSSHFCSAERQYRFPLEYGCQRPQTSQWTVTGSGALVLGEGNGPYIHSCTIGQIEDLGVTDMNNMGAAMAPAAASTLIHFFEDTKTSPEDYDMIYTGDLGYVGSNLLYELIEKSGKDIRSRHSDCGLLIYDRKNQDVHAGGSGCGCSASVLCSYVMHRFEKKEFKNVLFMSTGALMSPTSANQGENIPVIAHLINIKSD